MNTHRTTARLLSLALSLLVTGSTLAAIDTLARNDEPAANLAARVATLAQRPA